MNNKNLSKRNLIGISIILSILLTSAYGIMTSSVENDFLKEDTEIQEDIEQVEGLNKLNPTEELQSSLITDDPWWNETYFYRKVINITNPLDENLENFVASINFNYTEMRPPYTEEAKIQDDCKDIRIVTNNRMVQYYFVKDLPKTDNVTVWFKVNVSARATNLDYYLYYGASETVDISYHKFDGNFTNSIYGFSWYQWENNVEDTFGNYDGAVERGSVTYTTGTIGDCVQMDVDSIRLLEGEEGNNHAALYQENFSMSIWFRSTATTGGTTINRIVTRDKSEYYGLLINQDNDGSQQDLYMEIQNTEKHPSQTNNEYVTVNTWYHIIFTFDTEKNEFKMVVNGDDVLYDGVILSGFSSWEVLQSEHPRGRLQLGANLEASPSGNNFIGDIDDVRLYDYALSTEEIERIHNNNFTLKTRLNTEQEQFAAVNVICRDVDGNIIPYANVTLVNHTAKLAGKPKADWLIDSKKTDLDGKTDFQNLDYGTYNFTVNYTIPFSGESAIVYNSSKAGFGEKPYFNFTGLDYTVYLTLNMTTINFEVDDWDGYTMTLGYIEVWDQLGGTQLDEISLDENGLAEFRWVNTSSYYYKLYYENNDYRNSPILINESYIYRQDYVDFGRVFEQDIIYVNQSNKYQTPPALDNFLINEEIHTNRSSSFTLQRLNKANISLVNMKREIDKVNVYYIDSDGGSSESNKIMTKDFDTASGDVTEYKFNIDIRKPNETCAALENDHYRAFGFRIEVYGLNTSSDGNSWGYIKINTTEKWHYKIRTALSKIRINCTDDFADPIYALLIQVNGTGIGSKPTSSLVNLTTDTKGWAYGKKNSELPFYYLRGHNYTFRCYKSDNLVNFRPTKIEPDGAGYIPEDPNSFYNFTLMENSTLHFKVNLDPSQYVTNFSQPTGPSEVTHGELMTFSVNYTYKSPQTDPDYVILENPDSIKCQIRSLQGKIYKTIDPMTYEGQGIYKTTINSGELPAGNSSKQYWVKITGSKISFTDPSAVVFLVTINAKPTSLTFHNNSNYNEKYNTTNVPREYYNEKIKISVKYFNDSSNNNPIPEANLFYSWQGSNYQPVSFGVDPNNNDYYMFELNTSKVDLTSKYRIEVTAYKENYSIQDSIGFDIEIIDRETIIKRIDAEAPGTTDLLNVPYSIAMQEQHEFFFQYNDTDNDEPISNAEATYTWYKIDNQGNKMSKEAHPNEEVEGSGILTENSGLNYSLDFSIGKRLNGSYIIFITLDKENYESRNVLIDLTITIRPTFLNGTDYYSNPQEEPQIVEIYTGEEKVFEFTYKSKITGGRLATNLLKDYYKWTQVGANKNGTLKLNRTESGIDYLLDFDTENRDPGKYTLIVYLESTNHTLQTYTISLEIKIRQINFTLSGFTGSQISIKQGIKQTIQLTLTDNSRGGSPLLGANVTLRIGGQTIILTDGDGDGVYTGTFDSSLVNTFLQQEALTGTITVEKENYETKEITVTVVVRMVDTPFLEGVPLFWMIMGIVLVGGIIGSLGTYRYIQVAKIPKFIKKVKRIKKSISGDGSIDESDLYPSKEEFIVKKLGDKWEILGISLADVLGIEITKGKKMPDQEKTVEEKRTIKKEKVKLKKEKTPKEKKQKEPKVKKEKAPKEKKPEKATKEDTKKPQGGADE